MARTPLAVTLLLVATTLGSVAAHPAPHRAPVVAPAAAPLPAASASAPAASASAPAAPPSPAPAPAAATPNPNRGTSTAPRGRWAWPLDPRPQVIRRFDPPAQRWHAGHRGVDLAAAEGAPVLAAADGVVAFAGVVAGKPVVSIDHASGLRSTYEPVRALVTAGATVTQGQTIGTLAAADGHCSPASCLHWGARRGRDYVDPLSLVGARQVILLPLR